MTRYQGVRLADGTYGQIKIPDVPVILHDYLFNTRQLAMCFWDSKFMSAEHLLHEAERVLDLLDSAEPGESVYILHVYTPQQRAALRRFRNTLRRQGVEPVLDFELD